VDGYWERYASACVRGTVNGGSRPWLAALDANGVAIAAAQSGCVEWLDTVRKHARDIDQDVRAANETARRAGVFPGVLRDLRRQHRLDWNGWDR
jgi:hypothetical protein